MENVVFKTDLLRGAKGEKGDTGSTESVPTDGVLAYVGETTPQGYEEIQVSDIFTDIYADIDAVKDMISDAYDPTATYAVGDYCIYNNALYRCNTAIATGEAFTPAKWDATHVAEELAELTERVERGSVSVTADGVKSYTQIFDDLYALIDTTKITAQSYIIIGNSIYNCFYYGTYFEYMLLVMGTSAAASLVQRIAVVSTGSVITNLDFTGTFTDLSAIVPTSGTNIKLYY